MKIISNTKWKDYNWLKLADAYASFFISEILNEEESEFKQIFYSLDKDNAMAMRDLTVTTALTLYELLGDKYNSVYDWLDDYDDAIEQAWKSVTCAVENYTDGEEPLQYAYYQDVILGEEEL